jgi:hypothetical protein
VRAPSAALFSPGAGHLVGGGLIGDLNTDEITLNCYRLADRYHQNPEVFLAMPVSRIDGHIRNTIKLIEAQNRARPRNDD